MNHSYKLLGGMLAMLFVTLLFLQGGTGFFSPKNAFTFSRPQQSSDGKQSNRRLTVITGGSGGVNITNTPSKGARVPVPQCTSGITSTPADVLKLLAPGWTLQDLGEQYRNETKQILCYDNWKDEWAVPGGTWIKITDFLNTMHWPADLFNASAGSQILVVSRPNDTLKPSSPTTPQNQTKQDCNWTPSLGPIQPTINVCDFATVILKAILLTPLKGAVNAVGGDTNSFLWTTPVEDTYKNPSLALYWNASLYIINALLAAIIVWVGLRYMMSKSFGSWLSYADLLEILPRIIMALIAAYISARICQVVIDGSNALSSIFSTDLLSSLNTDPQDLFTTFSQIFLCLLILLLVVEEAVRIAILLVLIGFAPIWAFCGALRETQFIFKGGLKLLFFVSLLQPCQSAVISLGQHLTANIGGNTGTPLYYLVSIALMLFVLFMMGWFLRAGGLSMPFGFAGVTGAVVGSRAMAGLARVSGRGIAAAGRGYFRGSIFDKKNTDRGGSNSTGGGGSNNTGGRGSNNTGGGGSNNGGSAPNPGGAGGSRKVKRLPRYDPYKSILKNSQSVQAAVRRPAYHPPLRRTAKPSRAQP